MALRPLSDRLRDIAGLLAECGIDFSYETVRSCANMCGPAIAANIWRAPEHRRNRRIHFAPTDTNLRTRQRLWYCPREQDWTQEQAWG